jgi:hypothetical protein
MRQERWTTKDARAYYERETKRRHKYGSRKKTIDGITFDSKHESDIYLELKQLEQAGQITELKLQVSYPLEINGFLVCHFVADFTFKRDGELVVVDAKGFETPQGIIKHKLMMGLFGIRVELR